MKSTFGKYVFDLFVIFCFFIFSSSALAELIEKPMVVIIPSYNNINWYDKNLESVLTQNYENFRVIYTDDCSKDGTADAVANYIKIKGFIRPFTLNRNVERVGAMANLYEAIHSCKNDEIAVLLDGDDWFYHSNVLKQLNEIYSSKDVWFTHGRMTEFPSGYTGWCEPIPSYIIATKAYRTFKHPTHLRTFYAGLFKKIRLQDFLYKGEFLKMAWDMAIMYPLLEMAEERHVFVTDINYVYNIANPLNDNKVDALLQQVLDKLIRNRPPYKRLQSSEEFLN